MSHPLFPKVVNDSWIKDGSLKENVEKFTADVKIWNKEVFGDIFQRKKWVEARLRGIQSNIVEGPNEYLLNLESQHRKEYFEIVQQEKELWSVKSRYNWLIQGDRNTRFFHTSTLIRKRRNKIVYLKNNQGNWVHDETQTHTVCNTVYKVVTKIIVKRLKPMLPKLIPPPPTPTPNSYCSKKNGIG